MAESVHYEAAYVDRHCVHRNADSKHPDCDVSTQCCICVQAEADVS